MNDYAVSNLWREVTIEYEGRKLSLKYDLDTSHWPNKEMHTAFDQHGLHDPELVQLMIRLIKPGDTVLDGGACIGYFTVLLSQLVGPQGKVIAFEPGDNNLPYLKRNLGLNHCKNVQVITQPLWSTVQMVSINQEPSGINSLIPHGTSMLSTTLSRYVPAKLIKLDLEGCEADVLTSLRGPHCCPYVISELNETQLSKFNRSQGELREVMRNRGYETYIISTDGSMPIQVPPNTKLACTRLNTNVLFSTPTHIGRIWSLIAV